MIQSRVLEGYACRRGNTQTVLLTIMSLSDNRKELKSHGINAFL